MQYIGFTMDGSEYAIPILKVQEIINVPPLTKMPQAPPYVKGITNLRGRVIPVMNLRRIIGWADGVGAPSGGKVIVLTSGRITFGILVDGIAGVVDVDDSDIEHPADLNAADAVSGVAKFGDRLLVMLDVRKLIPMEDLELFEDEVCSVTEAGDKVELVKKVDGMGGEMFVKEIVDAKDFFERKGLDLNDPRFALFDDMVDFMNAATNRDYEKADRAIQNIFTKGRGDLYKEVGKVTRKLHDSIKCFKEAIDPRLKDIATTDMPRAVDRLNYVIEKTEEAANRTLVLAEKYIMSMDDFSSHVRNLDGPEESVAFLKTYKGQLETDLMDVITTQSFQDITGQSIRKVIKVVGDIEDELVRLITTFGVKMEDLSGGRETEEEKVSQSDVDDLLRDFGF